MCQWFECNIPKFVCISFPIPVLPFWWYEMFFLSQLLLLCCSFSSHTCPQSYGWCDTIYRSVKSSRISQICGYCGWILTCINCKMRKHKRTQVCCSCILLNSWCGYVQKLSIQMKNHNRKQSFWGFFHISRCSNLPVCHLTTWEKNKLPTCTAGLQDVSVKMIPKSFSDTFIHLQRNINICCSVYRWLWAKWKCIVTQIDLQ